MNLNVQWRCSTCLVVFLALAADASGVQQSLPADDQSENRLHVKREGLRPSDAEVQQLRDALVN